MADISERTTVLAAVNARLGGIAKGGSLEVAAVPEALEELVRLRAHIDMERDLEAAQAAGLMFYFRSLATLDLEERARSFVEAMALLRVVMRAHRGTLPDPLIEIFKRNPSLLAPDWHEALAAEAEGLSHTGIDDPVRLSIAIAMQRKVVDMLPLGSSLRFEYSSNLGVYLRLRHELTNSLKDVREALDIARSCLAHPDTVGPKRASLLFNLSLAHRDQHRCTGSEEDVDGWLRSAREALEKAAPTSANRATMVKNLVDALRASHRDAPDSSLDEIIDVSRREASLANQRSTTRDFLEIDLSAALITRFRLRGTLNDINEAIRLLRQLIDAELPGGERPGCLSNLGIALMMRYDAQGADSDLEEGLDACRQALQVARDDDRDRPMYSSNLCLLALTHASRHRWAKDDLQLAIRAGRAALEATPPSDPRYAVHASNLTTALLASFHGQEPSPGDLDNVIELGNEAAAHQHGSELGSILDANVALAELRRYQVTGSREDLDDAVGRYRRALPGLPANMPERADALLALSGALMARNATGDLDACLTASQEATRIAGASLATRFHAANRWGEAASMQHDWPLACQAYSEAIRLLKYVASGPLSRRDQEYALARAAGLCSRVAAAYLQSGDVVGAVEAFEDSHAVLLAHELDTRIELRSLEKAHRDLATDYQQTRERLLAIDDQPPTLLDPRSGGAALPCRSAAIGRERYELLQRLEALLAKIRGLEGLSGFQSRVPIQDLYTATAECPVVLLSVSPVRCDALIVAHNSVNVVPLPEVSPQKVQEQTMLLWGAIDDAQQDFVGLGTPVFAEHAIDTVLTWLWDAVAEPVMDALRITSKPQTDADWPRICWCPSGFLSLLPLHAAGHHRTRADSVPRTVIDRAISTYTPTLHAVLAPPPTGAAPNPCECLVVAMPTTPGQKNLPGASVEARFLRGLLGERARVIGAVDGGPPARVR